MQDGLFNTDIDYSSTGSGSYNIKQGVDNSLGVTNESILSQSDKDYLTALSQANKTTETPTGLTNADYYPALEQSVIQGYMSGSEILPNMPLIAPQMAYPFAALDARQQQEEAYQQAQNNLILASKQYELSSIKDNIKNTVFAQDQLNTYNEQAKQYTDVYGVKGYAAYRGSDDYKMTKLKFAAYSNIFNDTWDEALKNVLYSQNLGEITETTKTTKTGETETTTEKTAKLPEYYQTEELLNLSNKFIYGSTKENKTLDDIDDLLDLGKKIQMTAGGLKTANVYAKNFSDNISTNITDKYYSTGDEDVFKIETIKGLTDDQIDTWAKDKKGDYTKAFGYAYSTFYKDLQVNKPTKDEWLQYIKDQTIKQVTDDLKNVSTPNYGMEAYKSALRKQEKVTDINKTENVSDKFGNLVDVWQIPSDNQPIIPISTDWKGINTETKGAEPLKGKNFALKSFVFTKEDAEGNKESVPYALIQRTVQTDTGNKDAYGNPIYESKVDATAPEIRIPASWAKTAAENAGLNISGYPEITPYTETTAYKAKTKTTVAPHGQTVIQNGVTYNWNSTTGKYEVK